MMLDDGGRVALLLLLVLLLLKFALVDLYEYAGGPLVHVARLHVSGHQQRATVRRLHVQRTHAQSVQVLVQYRRGRRHG